jgi:hypothetical protein
MPIDQLEHLMRVAPGEHHHQRRAGHCRPSQVQAGEEANKDRHEHNTDEGEQTAIQFCSPDRRHDPSLLPATCFEIPTVKCKS